MRRSIIRCCIPVGLGMAGVLIGVSACSERGADRPAADRPAEVQNHPLQEWQAPDFEKFLVAADSVEVVVQRLYPDSSGSYEPDVLVLKDKKSIEHLTSGVELRSKERCKCSHTSHLIFRRGEESIKISYCEHCFDVVVHEGNYPIKYFHMPKSLYDRIALLYKEKEGERNR